MRVAAVPNRFTRGTNDFGMADAVLDNMSQAGGTNTYQMLNHITHNI